MDGGREAAARLVPAEHTNDDAVACALEVLEAGVEERRYLALIVRKATQGILVVFARPLQPLVRHVLPIDAAFTKSISQRQGSDSPARRDWPARAKFILRLNELEFLTEDAADYSPLLEKLKELKLDHDDWSFALPYETQEPPPLLPVARRTSQTSTSTWWSTLSSAYLAATTAATTPTTPATVDDRPGLAFSSTPTPPSSDYTRAEWIYEKVKAHEQEYTTSQSISVYCGTFNVNDKEPASPQDLGSWLDGAKDCTLVVLAFQEFDLSTEAFVRYSSLKEDRWRAILDQALGEDYEKLASKQLVGALSLIYVRRSDKDLVASVSTASVGTGIFGFVANKGATAIRVKLQDTVVVFVNSHLTPFEQMTAQRNQDFNTICNGLVFEEASDGWTPRLNVAARDDGKVGIFDAHVLYWAGDLNYRIELARSDVLRLVENKDVELLLRFDQLKACQKQGTAWTDFVEAPITFLPTFKFDVGTVDTYDTSEKQRTPSYTDRVLWVAKADYTTSKSYAAHHDVVLSDHKPVSSIFETKILTVLPEERERVQKEIISELDKMDNDALPDVQILPAPSVEFETIRYGKEQTVQVEVVNVGPVIAHWHFVAKPNSTSLTPPWLRVSPLSGLVLPKERSVVNFTILVDSSCSEPLNFAPDSRLDELLILSLDKKDLFLSVSAPYLPTCFGNSLARLAALQGPIRSHATSETSGDLHLPSEMRRCLDFLAEHGMDEDELFLQQGPDADVEKVHEALDTGEPFPESLLQVDATKPKQALETDLGKLSLESTDGSSPKVHESRPGVHAVADCFLRLLESLIEPLITYAAYAQALQSQSRDEAYVVVHSLPQINRDTLLYLVGFLRVLLKQTSSGTARAARADRLAVVFSTLLLRPDRSRPLEFVAGGTKLAKQFVSYLLLD